MTLWGLTIADLLVLVGYLAGITVLGLFMARSIRSIGDFCMPRKFGKGMMVMHSFGTGTDSGKAASVASKSFTVGLSGIWYQWLWLFCTPFYWLIAPLMRRFRALTTADVYEARFNKSVAVLFAVVGAIMLTFNLGFMLKASGKTLDAITAGQIPTNYAIVFMTVLFVAYGVAGGLAAAIVTDFVQGILTIVFSFMLLPFILDAVGGISGLTSGAHALNAEQLSLVAPEIGVFYVCMASLTGLVGITAQPHTMGNCAAGRTELDGAVGFMGGSFIKRFCTVAWALTGLAAIVHFSRAGIAVPQDTDKVYGMVAHHFLQPLGWGLLGLFIATMLAAVMSSCDSQMIASSSLIVENIYKPLVRGRSDGHYVWAARIATLAVVGAGVFFAYTMPNLKESLKIFWKIPAMIGIAFWFGLFWRRTTSPGAWAGTLAAAAAWWMTTQGWFIDWVASLGGPERAPFIFKGKIYEPWVMLFNLGAGVLCCIVVSLLTRPPAREKLERFYALTRTPVTPGEQEAEPCTLPPGVAPAPRRVFLPNSSLELPVPRPRAVAGFLVGWALVAAIIYGTMWIMGL